MPKNIKILVSNYFRFSGIIIWGDNMILKLEPIFYDKIWGGSKLKTTYQYSSTNQTGEVFGISGLDGKSNVISSVPFKGMTIRELYNSNKELFGNYPSDEFPILIKVIDALKDLSIQIHPNDEYAKAYNSLGKTECWYILDAEEDTEIIVGHNAKTKEEFVQKVENKEYSTLLNKFPIKKGDFFDIKAGTIHAICENTMILEVQQSSDITFRFYDYDRLENGQPRELHQKEAIDVVNVPQPKITNTGETEYFKFDILSDYEGKKKADVYGDYFFIMEGSGMFDDEPVQKGDFLFVPCLCEYEVQGKMTLSKIKIK